MTEEEFVKHQLSVEKAALMFFCGFEGRHCRNDYVKDPRYMSYEFKCKKIKR